MQAGLIFGGTEALMNFNAARMGGTDGLGEVLFLLGQMFVRVNFALAIFNMLPIPPLDGSSLVHHFFIRGNMARERFWMMWQRGLGFLVIYFLFFYLPPARGLLWKAILLPSQAVFDLLGRGAGGI
jgi:Zn-dependent protease